ncbi:MAG: CgeB family protein [Ginsengibacter sp.]
MSDLSILYVGSLATWCNSLRRYQAIKRMYSCTEPVDTDPYILAKYISGFQHHLNFGPGVSLLNMEIRRRCRQKKYDIVLVDNKPFLSRKTLRFIKQKNPDIRIANLLTDDPFGKHTISWPRFKRTARFYDVIFVQRKVNISELKNIGVKRVEICYRSFDPEYNKPMTLTGIDHEKYGTTIGFVGTYENIRASYIAYLIEKGIPVSVIGNDWPGGEYWDIVKPFYRGPSVFEEEYVKAINGMEIALHFLRHANRDEQDSRTFEIAASKVFMIAERSALHLQLFKEDEEVVFFSSKEELLEKVKYYLGAAEKREQIALNAYNRCFKSGYDHESRMRRVIDQILYG